MDEHKKLAGGFGFCQCFDCGTAGVDNRRARRTMKQKDQKEFKAEMDTTKNHQGGVK